MSRVPFRVHGPYQHRRQWRLDVFEDGKRYKLSFKTYAEALAEARRVARDGTAVGNSVGNGSDFDSSNVR